MAHLSLVLGYRTCVWNKTKIYLCSSCTLLLRVILLNWYQFWYVLCYVFVWPAISFKLNFVFFCVHLRFGDFMLYLVKGQYCCKITFICFVVYLSRRIYPKIYSFRSYLMFVWVSIINVLFLQGKWVSGNLYERCSNHQHTINHLDALSS